MVAGKRIDVRALRFIAFHQAFLRHDLEKLENRRIPGLLSHVLQYLPDRAGAVVPEHAENGEFGISWAGLYRVSPLRVRRV